MLETSVDNRLNIKVIDITGAQPPLSTNYSCYQNYY